MRFCTKAQWALFLFVAIVQTAGADTIDQSSTGGTTPNGIICPFFSTCGFAQTFTAGLTGQLTGVRIDARLNSGNFLLSINSVSGGVPTSTVLDSVPLSAFTTFPLTQTILLSGIQITAGTQYAIVILGTGSGSGVGLEWLGSGPNPYLGGSGFSGGGANPWTPLPDFNFQTEVNPRAVTVPEPASLLLLATGLRIISARQASRKERKAYAGQPG